MLKGSRGEAVVSAVSRLANAATDSLESRTRRLRIRSFLTLRHLYEFGNVPVDKKVESMSSIDQKLESLGLQLPPAPKPVGLYKPVLIVGNLAYVSGHGPLKSDGSLILGRVGADLDVAAGQAAAKQTALAMLSSLKSNLGTLDRIVRVVKLLGLVRCTDDFGQSPAVINGCSQVFVDLWGSDLGIGVRSALGTNSLPGGMAVEVEAIFEIRS